MKAQLTVFDGADCIGGSKIHLKAGETGLFLDFGTNFKRYGLYFEEFLTPRTARGIHDLLMLGVIPPLEGIYRQDVFTDDLKIESGIRPKVDAIFLSHAHMDHIGNVGLLNADIPVYASAMTAVIAKAMQDCGKVGMEGEVAYYSYRTPVENNPKALGMMSNVSCQGREFRLVEDGIDMEGLRDFMGRSFGRKGLDSKPIDKAKGKVEGISFEAIPVDHSVFGANAFVFDLFGKSLVYTGDFRLHGLRQDITETFISRLKDIQPDYLIVEGTNMGGSKGSALDTRTSEEDVFKNCLAAVMSTKDKMVVADFGPRNIERLKIFLDIAKQTGRKLVITAKDAFLLQAMRLADKSVPDVLADPDIAIFEDVKKSRGLWEKEFVWTEYGSKYIDADVIKSAQAEYIMAFSYYDLKHLLDVMPDGGIYIYSTCEAFSEEMIMDVWRLSNWLEKFKFTPVGFRIQKRGPMPEQCHIEFDKGYHASGHVSEDELVSLIEDIRTGTVIPVHTEHPEIFAERLSGTTKVLLPMNGEPIDI